MIRRIFSWRKLRWLLASLGVLITLLAIAWTEENWRGKRDWEKFRNEWEAKGEKFDPEAFIPPPVPDEQNFATTPFLAPLYDFNPLPLKPGQSVWRDTNAMKRAEDFGDFKNFANGERNESFGSWVTARKSDLTYWATVLNGSSAKEPKNRTAAAAEVLRGLEKYTPVLDELTESSRRPYCRFAVRHEKNPFDTLLLHLSVLKRIGLVYRIRAEAELAEGKTDPALADTKMILYLADGTRSEPTLFSYLVRLSLVTAAIQPVWEGLADHRWNDAQLQELQQRLGRIDLLQEYGLAMRGERSYANGMFAYLRDRKMFRESADAAAVSNPYDPSSAKDDSFGKISMPNGWFYQNQLALNRMFQQFAIDNVDVGAHRIDPANIEKNEATLQKDLDSGLVFLKIFARQLFPAVEGSVRKFAYAQAAVDEAVIAIALERYRLAQGQYPETPQALSPRFIEKLPHDLITGRPFIYRRTSSGGYVLYSVGWNITDDGGEVSKTKDGSRQDDRKGDWVWKSEAADLKP